MRTSGFDGVEVVLSEERLEHIIFRHPELKNTPDLILSAVHSPDEVYLDSTGAIHALKKQNNKPSDYIVVIYSLQDGRGYIRTAYYTSTTRKTRRYKEFKKLKPS